MGDTYNGWPTDLPPDETTAEWMQRLRSKWAEDPSRSDLLAEAVARLEALLIVAIEAQKFLEKAADVAAEKQLLPPDEHKEFTRADFAIFKLLSELEEPVARIKADNRAAIAYEELSNGLE